MHRALAVAVLVSSLPALALTQPNGAAIPSAPGCDGGKPTGLGAVFACQCGGAGACNIGAVCASATSCDDGHHATCETTLAHVFNDNSCIPSTLSGIDPAADAKTTPETFHPTCGLTFTVASRGTSRFHNAFGWYNLPGGLGMPATPPLPGDLHVMLDCNAQPGAAVVLDVRNDPAYKGGDIGFFLVTPEDHASKGACAGGDCCASPLRLANGVGYVYYSERALNPDNTSGAFIHLLTYGSKLATRKFYFAWEDIFGGSNNDFTDLVTSVEGVECGGAGAPCDTGKKGVCKSGTTSCSDGTLRCEPLAGGEPERCDGLDNDCNGIIDDGASCASDNICLNGECVPRCTLGQEFGCTVDLVCDEREGICRDPRCQDVRCAADEICRGGACHTACDGIVCPHGIACRDGACVDPCRDKQCAAGQVCAGGLCLPGCTQCGGVGCAAPLACDSSTGACVDPSCPGGCPAGQYCDGGACKDACAGAVCPPKHTCAMGQCIPAAAPQSNGGGDGTGGGTGGNGATDGGAG
ncbi:MAG: hypothetical protein JWN44_1139, partial [Myxococcales bacterium]|nr:hypothetical protein [Myxococcales bacterium]